MPKLSSSVKRVGSGWRLDHPCCCCCCCCSSFSSPWNSASASRACRWLLWRLFFFLLLRVRLLVGTYSDYVGERVLHGLPAGTTARRPAPPPLLAPTSAMQAVLPPGASTCTSCSAGYYQQHGLDVVRRLPAALSRFPGQTSCPMPTEHLFATCGAECPHAPMEKERPKAQACACLKARRW